MKLKGYQILTIILVFIMIIVVGSWWYQYVNVVNIFDEIYDIERMTYRRGNVMEQHEDVRVYWASDDEFVRKAPITRYKEDALPPTYINIEIQPDFEDFDMLILIKKEIAEGVYLGMWNYYYPRRKTMECRLRVSEGGEYGRKFTDDEGEIREYLAQSNVTVEDLNQYYVEIVRDKVLVDWCEVYDSEFTPDNYAEVETIFQWEDW